MEDTIQIGYFLTWTNYLWSFFQLNVSQLCQTQLKMSSGKKFLFTHRCA